MALSIAMRGSEGLWMVNGHDLKAECPFNRDTSPRCKVMIYSRDGSLFAWCNGDSVNVVRTSDCQPVCKVDAPKAVLLMFSPMGRLLATWQPYTVDKDLQHGVPNLHLWDVASGKLVKALIQKKAAYWVPQWSNDEKICCRNVNNELHFFEDGNFDEIKTKLHLQKVAGYSLSGAGPPYLVAGYVPGVKGQPSFVRVYKYPNFAGNSAAIANRTFFKAEKVEMLWNKLGTGMLLLTTTETSESSYYGDQGLHYININGESSLVHLGKNGPVYHIEWSPKGTEFCVVYGFMPAKATLYNTKTEEVFDFGTGPRNMAFYNQQGTILCLCGFGNLRGNMEFWDVKQKKLIAQPQSPDTTCFQWCADGEHIVTATTAPRLRVGNGYRIWHYTGVILEQVQMDKEKELWEVFWQPSPAMEAKEKPISYRPVQSDIETPEPENKTAVYRPPGMRGKPLASTKLHEYELPSNMKKSAEDANKPVSKNKKKREAKKAKEMEQATAQPSQNSHPAPQAQAGASNYDAAPSTGNPETDKKIRNLRKKLQQIEKIKEQQSEGRQLEKNQLDKLKTEAALIQEMEDLQLS